jgi:uncharacterized protein YggT (Ycf19 family)
MNEMLEPRDKPREVEREVRRGGHEHRDQFVKEAEESSRVAVFKLSHLIWLLFGIIQGLIGIRFLLKALAADPNNPFASLVYNTTDLFLWPFEGLIANPSANGMVLEITSLIAILVYALLAWAIWRLIWVLFHNPSTGSTTIIERRHE